MADYEGVDVAKGICSIEDCNRDTYSRGWCCKHYKHWRRHGDPLPLGRSPGSKGKPGGICSIEGCEEPYFGRTWCKPHYWRWRRNNDPLAGNRSPRPERAVKTHRDAPVGHRHCLRCDQIKTLDQFHKDRRRSDGVTFYCKDCNIQYVEDLRTRDPERYLEMARRRAYRYVLKQHGMTFEDYDALLSNQGGVCAICKGLEVVINPSGVVKMMAIDHDHVTGRVRGLLCDACNRGLGAFKDTVAYLSAAIEYLNSSMG